MIGFVWLVLSILGSLLFLAASPLAATDSCAHGLNALELVTLAVPVGIVASAWITYIFSSLLSMLDILPMLLSMIATVVIVASRANEIMHAWQRLSHRIAAAALNFWEPDNRDNAVIIVLLGVVVVPLYMLVSSRMIPEINGELWSGGSCWADLPIHMHIVESFLTGRNSDVSFTDMHSPIFAGENIYYPFLPDWHAAVMVRFGSSVRSAFLWTCVLLTLSMLAGTYFLALRVTRSRTAALLSLALLFLCGGMGGVGYLFRDGWSKATTVDVAQSDITGDNKVWWFAFMPHVFLPQRGATFAYPLAIGVMSIVWLATDAAAPWTALQRTHALMHAGVFAAMLPFVQTPSFLGLGIIIGTFFLMDAHKWLADLRLLRGWIYAGVLTVLLAAPQLLYFNGHLSKAKSGNFMSFGWLHLRPENQLVNPAGFPWIILPFGDFLRFWCNNLGPAVPVFLLTIALIALDVVTAAVRPAPRTSPRVAEPTSPRRKTIKEELTSNTNEYASLLGHFWLIFLAQLPTSVSDVLSGRRRVDTDTFDRVCRQWNENSVSGRAFDQLKLALGGLIIFLVGNYVIFQPWDRDNTKVLYLWVFVYAVLAAGVYAAPIEAALGSGPGVKLMTLWTTLQKAPDAARPSGLVRTVSVGASLALPILLFLSCFTGLAMLVREYNHNYVLFDRDQVTVGLWIKENLPPKSVIVHKDDHIIPSGSIAGRPALIGYAGWVESHGYNYHERQNDREYILKNALKESDQRAYNLMRRWGVRYVLGDNLPTHPRPGLQAWEQANAARQSDPNVMVPNYDPNLYLDNQLRLLYGVGRFGVYEVLGYSGVPGT